MKAPKCRLCGEVHWSNEPCAVVSTAMDALVRTHKANRLTPKPVVTQSSGGYIGPKVVTAKSVVVTRKPRSSDRHKGSRAAYMRAYRLRRIYARLQAAFTPTHSSP